MRDDFYGQDVSLPALAGTGGRLARLHFFDCELRGPATLRIGAGVQVGAVEFDLPQEQALVPGEPPADALLLEDFALDNCRLHGLRVAGAVDELRRHFGDCVFGDERAPFRD